MAKVTLRPCENAHLEADWHGELRYEIKGDTAFFVFNGFGLVPGTYYGLYSEGNLLGLGFSIESAIVNIQGYGPSEVMEGSEFSLFSLDMTTIRPDEHVLQSDSQSIAEAGKE